MKVGTDGVLLGAWAGVRPSDRRILDVGTGTGLIALMMAQRAPEALITGVDVEEVSQARENAAASPWGGRVAFVQCPVQEFAPDERFDLIVSNPPFFVDSLTCPDEGRTTARHAVRLPFDQLRDAVVRLLAAEGRFAVILPTDEARAFYRRLPRIPRADPLYGRTHHATPSGQTPADGVCARKRQLRPALRFSSRLLRTGRRHGRTRAVHPRIPGLNP